MNKSTNLIMALGLCTFVASFTAAQPLADANDPQGTGVQMTLTHLSVNDQTLDLSWKITNNTDHDIWICDSMTAAYPDPFLERFLDEDAKTLMIRKRFDLPIKHGLGWLYPPITSRYVRLRSGEEKAESVSVALPITPDRISAGQAANAECAERLALEIGYYDEDLPGLILEIVELAEHLNCDLNVGLGDRVIIGDRFFGGWQMALYFDQIIGFAPNVRSAGAKGEMWMLHMGHTRMGEKVLRTEIDGVSIPYKSNNPPLVETETPSDVTMALTELDVNDTNLELGWKTTNNTDHDVWICDSPSEWFLDRDTETLMIRRRFGLPIEEGVHWEFPYIRARYIRLRPGEEKAETFSSPLPVSPKPVFVKYSPDAQDATRLVLEIGFFNEDLQQLILRIVELSEKICDVDPTIGAGDLVDLVDPFFGGWIIAFTYKIDPTFRDSVASGDGPIVMPYGHSNLLGEQVLRIEVDNVSIPFGFPHSRGQ